MRSLGRSQGHFYIPHHKQGFLWLRVCVANVKYYLPVPLLFQKGGCHAVRKCDTPKGDHHTAWVVRGKMAQKLDDSSSSGGIRMDLLEH